MGPAQPGLDLNLHQDLLLFRGAVSNAGASQREAATFREGLQTAGQAHRMLAS